MLQLKGTAADITSANNIGLASAVRIRATNAGTVTVAAASGTSNYAGQLVLTAGEVVTVAKQPTDTIACSGSGMSCTAIGYHY